MARILLAALKEENLAHIAISSGGFSKTHEVAVSETLIAAYKLLESEHFDLIVCNVCFDESQIFDLWAAARRKEPRVTFLAYREQDSDLGEAMEVLVNKVVSHMDGYLDLREFQAPDDCAAFVAFIELGLISDQLESGRLNNQLFPTFGTMVKKRRSKLGISLEALSEASALNVKLLRALENGTQMDLELNELWKLSIALDTLPSRLIKEAEEY